MSAATRRLLPRFTPGTTATLTFRATKDNQATSAQIAVVVTNVAGKQASCV